MTTAIRALGSYAQLDEEGFVRPMVARAPASGRLSQLVDELGRAFTAHYGPRLHSAYLRGSLAFGHAPSTASDVDAFVLLHPEPGVQSRWRAMDWTGELGARLAQHWCLDLAFDLHEARYSPTIEQDYPQLALLIALQSHCIAGTNLQPTLRVRYRPGPQMVVQLRWLAHDLAAFRRASPRGHAEFRALIKVILRSGFELVMAREGRYTTALYFCALSFARHYPNKAGLAWRLLECFVNPSPATPQAHALALQLGEFIVLEAQRHRPELDYFK